MSQFAYQSDANGSGASALKEHIDAIAASIPSAGGGTAQRMPPAPAATRRTTGRRGALLGTVAKTARRRLGIWDLAANVLRLSAKLSTIDAIDQRTAALQETFAQIRTPPQEQIKALSARGDALARAGGFDRQRTR